MKSYRQNSLKKTDSFFNSTVSDIDSNDTGLSFCTHRSVSIEDPDFIERERKEKIRLARVEHMRKVRETMLRKRAERVLGDHSRENDLKAEKEKALTKKRTIPTSFSKSQRRALEEKEKEKKRGLRVEERHSIETAKEFFDEDLAAQMSDMYMNFAIDKAKNDLKTFIQLVKPDYVISGFHGKMIEYLQQMVDSDVPGGSEQNPFLMFNTPPRHGKSLLCSILFPAWYIGRNPMHQVMVVTYNQDYSDNHISEPIRTMITTNVMFQRIFPHCQLSKTTKSKSTWRTDLGGIMNAAGIGSGLEGKGFNLLVIDDPMSHDQAMSKLDRDTIFQKWSGSLRTRALPDAKILFQMTRWHPDDLAGRILDSISKNKDSDKWRVIKFPAFLDEQSSLLLGRPIGDALWPEMYPNHSLLALKSGMNSAIWESEYMQRPTSIEGALIKAESWVMVSQKRKIVVDMTITSVDASYGNTKESDFSGIVTLSTFTDEDDIKKVIVRDVVKRRLPIQALREEVCDIYRTFRSDVVLIEPRAAGLSLAQLLRDTGLPVTTYDASRMGNKEYRVQLTTPYYESGRICAISEDSRIEELIKDCQGFPRIAHDDTVDALTQAILYLRSNRMLNSRMDDFIEDEDDIKYKPQRTRLHPFSLF